ncbi:hypothetical protein M407DRAFT_27523 [Tulasnella calospora MUT 4182]|uniref:BTB domain-containing protein n=1 Tax=Tulasnella calospora MUT 4182 TaxID=1051891 RepID=A0A0C3KNM4_9AGAM|nr:hypothetical protein M407DRAFT_27523 [Tulasnella calospora MUT 4182]
MSNDDIQRTPLSRHPLYYDSDYLTFAVDGYLFKLPVRRLKESKYFQDMLGSEHLGGSVEGKSDEHPITLGGITSFEMESFVGILDARVFGKEVQREWKQLAAALHLATMWEFEDVRTRLIKDMSQMISNGGVEPLDRVEGSIQCRVSDWLHPAYQVLCDRKEGVTTEEAKRLGMDRLAAIYRVRDRRHADAVNAANAAKTVAQNAQAAAQNALVEAQNALVEAQNAQTAAEDRCRRGGGHIQYGFAGLSRGPSAIPTVPPVIYTAPLAIQTVPVVQTPTLALIKAEDILSSLDGPLSCGCA